MKNRVVVTGMGVVSPIGDNIQDFWKALKSGKNGIDCITHFDTDKFDGDVIEEYDGVNIVVDGQSLEHIKGATLDYKEGLM